MTWNDVWEAVQEGLITIILLAISLCVSIATMYINKLKVKAVSQAEKIEDDRLKDLVIESINRVTYLVKSTVISLEQEFATDIRKKIESGEISPEDGHKALSELKDTAINTVWNKLSDNTKEILVDEIDDVTGYIGDLVSEYVYRLKNGTIDNTPLSASLTATYE